MAELTFKSAGVSTREIDLSQPSVSSPTGIPAGVIGTANKGPAFVPITIGNFSDFTTLFGATDGTKFGPLAVNEWLKNAGSATFVRVLGIGDGKQRSSSTGVVTNAGFFVGDKNLQSNGLVADNPYANSGDGASKGRTYFLGAFMSESNGSTVFSEAGIQQNLVVAKSVASFVAVQHMTGAIVIEDTAGTKKSYHFHSTSNGEAATATATLPAGVFVKTDGIAAATIASSFITQLADTDAHGGTITGGNNSTLAHFTQSLGGVYGNTSISYSGTGVLASTAVKVSGISKDTQFRSGSSAGGAAPILRGVLLAPSGVILHLSGNAASNGSDAPTSTNTAAASYGHGLGREGSLTGSVDLRGGKREFVILLNGHKGTSAYPTTLTASFDPIAPNYLSRVLNTDPLKIEQAGHLLYNHYPLHGNVADVTGSGVVRPSHYSKGSTAGSHEDIAFLLTSSLGRNATTDGSVPDYEDFKDRFSHAETPYVISQKFGNKPYNLFKIVALSAGSGFADDFKFSVVNIVRSKSNIDKFGTFDLLIRKGNDNDDNQVVLESFRGLSLDPDSVNYIGRRIGDQHAKFDFDTSLDSQKIVVEGSNSVLSRYIRVKISDDVVNRNIPDESLPVGFRGPRHLVTSGTMLASESDSLYSKTDLLQRLIEPPISYRENVTVGAGVNKRINSNFFWGAQSTLKIDATRPNKVSTNDALATLTPTIQYHQTHFPTHRTDTTDVFAGDNAGAANVNGSVLDSDLFNYNKFTLENIKVRTGSNSDATQTLADSEYWVSASYVRNGSISVDNTLKTRAFKVEDLDVVANRQYAKFTFFAQGGFDGVNIFNKEKANLTNNAAKYEIDQSDVQGGTAGPTISAYRKAVDIMGSTADTNIQLLAIPGIRNTVVTDYAISAVENRFDCLYIMDIEERDQVNSVITSSVQTPHVNNTVNKFKDRNLNTSFAASYFPNVTIVDPGTNTLISVPPSVSVLGAYSFNDKVGAPWTAPAGKSRGILKSVETSAVKLNRKNLDDLYDADINPITSFPGTNNIIWGQKTLLSNNTALDRINVRRLLISVRRSVRTIANSLLFEPNRESTLAKFSSLVDPILQNVQERNGVARYKVVIDSSTTTQADVENNTIRGKIYLQPTRTVEFVALDFVVTNSGAEI
jgi:phage tail sheath protein FI